MIPILNDYYAPGYLPHSESRSLPPYLPNVGLAMRRDVFDELGGYDEHCEAGEDADLCVRAARAGWDQFFEPRAHAFHEPRPDLRSLIRQWVWYGQGGSYFFFKQQRKRLEVYLSTELAPKMHHYRRIASLRRFPFPAMLFISPFLAGHALALSGILAFLAGLPKVSLMALSTAFLLPIGLYFRSPLRRLSLRELRLYIRFVYLINTTCILAGFLAGLKKRRLFIYPGI